MLTNMSNEWFKAIKLGMIDRVRQMIDNGQDVNQVDKRDKGPGLYWASCYGHDKICVLLLRRGATVNQQVRWGSIALHAACDRGQLECVKVLVAHQTLVNCQNAMGDTPLHLAAFRGHYEICRRLLMAGASATLVNHKNKTAIDESEASRNPKVTRLLIEGVPRQALTEQLQIAPRRREGEADGDNFYSLDQQLTRDRNGVIFQAENDRIVEGIALRPHGHDRRESIHLPEGEDANRDILEVQRNRNELDQRLSERSQAAANIALQQRLRTLEDKYDNLQVELAVKNECLDNAIREKNELQLQCNSKDHTIAQYLSANASLNVRVNNLETELHKSQTKSAEAEEEKYKLTQELFRLKRSLQCLLLSDSGRIKEYDDDWVTKSTPEFEIAPYRLSARGSSSTTATISKMSSNSSTQLTHSPTKATHSSTISSVSAVDDACDKFFQSSFNSCNTKALVEALKNFSISINGQDKSLPAWFSSCLRQRLSQCQMNNFTPHVQGNWVLNKDYIILQELDSDPSVKHQNFTCRTQHIMTKRGEFLLKEFEFQKRGELLPIEHIPAEYKMLVKIGSHRNTEQIYHMYEPPTTPIHQGTVTSHKLVLVLNYLPQTLSEFAAKVKASQLRLPEMFLLHLLYQLLSGVNHLVEKRVVHTNISRHTVYLDYQLRPMICKFDKAESVKESHRKIEGREDFMCSLSHVTESLSLHEKLLQHDLIHMTDVEAVGQLIYSLLETPVLSEDSDMSVSLEHVDSCNHYSGGLMQLIQQLCTARTVAHVYAKDALVRTGLLICRQCIGNLESRDDCQVWVQARIINNMLKTPDKSRTADRQLDVVGSMIANHLDIERDFLLSSSADDIWRNYQILHQQGIF